jgi:hypothetical protein
MSIETSNEKPCEVLHQLSFTEMFYKSVDSLSCPEGYNLTKSYADAIKCSIEENCSGSVQLSGPLKDATDMVSAIVYAPVNIALALVNAPKTMVCKGVDLDIWWYAFGGGVIGSAILRYSTEMTYNKRFFDFMSAKEINTQTVEAFASQVSYKEVFLGGPIGYIAGAGFGVAIAGLIHLSNEYIFDCSTDSVN